MGCRTTSPTRCRIAAPRSCTASCSSRARPMLGHVVRRLWSTLTVAVGVAAVIFVLLHLSGDPVALLVPVDAPPEVMQDTRRSLGLDRPLPEQFVRYLGRAATGDLGTS